MWNIAQVNIARMHAPSIDDPMMSGFVEKLDEINALAEESPGFVWRLKDTGGNATAISFNDDQRIIVNLSVWESTDHLKEFTYKSRHRDVLAKRHQWFENLRDFYMAIWYVPRFSFPSVEDARFRLNFMKQKGATPMAFTFAKTFTADEYILFLKDYSDHKGNDAH